jgi:phage shock protein PspC (stress-responsive transcriptional regulator)
MKKTIKANLGGVEFTFNDDAYALMERYIESLREALCAQKYDTNEILKDIECRSAEILFEEHPGNHIITSEDVALLIERLGVPEEIIADADPSGASSSANEEMPPSPPSSQPYPPLPPVAKRLYRNPEGKMIGGVCNGIATYFDVDPTWIRLASVLLLFVSFSTCAVIYIILWVVLPEARTTYQMLQLRGGSPTLKNIGDAVRNGFNRTSETGSREDPTFEQLNKPTGFKGVANGINVVVSVIAKVILVLLTVICVPVAIPLLVSLVTLVVLFVSMLFRGCVAPEWLLNVEHGVWGCNFAYPLLGVGIACLVVLFLVVPVIVILYLAYVQLFRGKPLTRSAKLWLLGIWLFSIAGLGVIGVVYRNDPNVISSIKDNCVVIENMDDE